MGQARALTLRYTARAATELADILDYISSRSPGGARHVQRRIQAALDMLRDHPNVGAQSTHPRLRRLVVNPFPYLVFYEVTANEVIIHGVRHAARRPNDLIGGKTE